MTITSKKTIRGWVENGDKSNQKAVNYVWKMTLLNSVPDDVEEEMSEIEFLSLPLMTRNLSFWEDEDEIYSLDDGVEL